MSKTEISISGGSAQKAIALKEKILKRFSQVEYAEENDLEPGTLEKILEEVKSMDYILGSNWGKVFDKYYDEYGISLHHFIEFEDFSYSITEYSDGTKKVEFTPTGLRL